MQKKEHKQLEKFQGLKEETEALWRGRASAGAVAPNPGEWRQIPGTNRWDLSLEDRASFCVDMGMFWMDVWL